MIKLNLQLFAKSSAYQKERRQSISVMKKTKLEKEPKEDEEKERKKKPTSIFDSKENITNSELISKKENYVLHQVNKNGDIGRTLEVKGKQLWEPLADEQLVYDKNSKTWHWRTKNGKGYVSFIIRRRR